MYWHSTARGIEASKHGYLYRISVTLGGYCLEVFWPAGGRMHSEYCADEARARRKAAWMAA